MHDRCGYSINKIEMIFREGKISKPTIIKILRDIKKEDVNNDQLTEIEINNDFDKQIDEDSINDDEFIVVGDKSAESDRQAVKNDDTQQNNIVYNDWTTARFDEFLNENKYLVEKYDESEIWNIATSMTTAAEKHKITEDQMKKVVIELHKRNKNFKLESMLMAVGICKKQELI